MFLMWNRNSLYWHIHTNKCTLHVDYLSVLMLFGACIPHQTETLFSLVIIFHSYLGMSSQIFHQAPDPNVPLPQPQSQAGSRRSRAICLSSGPRKPKSLYTPSLCLADADSESYTASNPHISHSLLIVHPLCIVSWLWKKLILYFDISTFFNTINTFTYFSGFC